MALDFFAGCVGGAAGVIVGHPFDTVKVSGLYKGISSPLFGVAGVNAIIFGVYGALRPYVSGSPGNDALWAHFAAGSISGAVQSGIASPMELVKTRMQVNQDAVGVKKLGAVEVLKGIYRNEGGLIRGVFKGWGITLGREIPGFGVYFASYEALTRFGEGEVGTLGMMLAGGMAGVLSWIVTFPIDVVKTRLQCDDKGKYRGAIDCARKTYESEGYRAFSRGLVSTVIRAFPTNAATFTVVTWIMRLAGGAPNDDIQDCRKYLDDLLTETSRLQEKLEDSLRLKVPHYFFGNSLTSCSLASQCAVSAQKYADRTQVYFNFYQSLQQQAAAIVEQEISSESNKKEGEGVEKHSFFHDDKLVDRLNCNNMQALQSTCISSRMRDDDDKDLHKRNGDTNAVLYNNHIPSTSKLSPSSNEIHLERETNASPVIISGVRGKNAEASNTSGSSLLQGNIILSHEQDSLPVRRKTFSPATPINNDHHIDRAGNSDDDDEEMRNAAAFSKSHEDQPNALTTEDYTYLSKSLDIPVHILKAAAHQHQSAMKSSIQPVKQGGSTSPSLNRPTSTRSSSRTQEAWRKYCKTPAVNLCKCFEDHCVCYL